MWIEELLFSRSEKMSAHRFPQQVPNSGVHRRRQGYFFSCRRGRECWMIVMGADPNEKAG